MKFHQFSEIFPLIEGAELDALVADIKAHGQHEAIWQYNGKILDGRNRFLACQKAKVQPKYRQFKGSDASALSFVLSANEHRRHLSASQRAMAASRLKEISKSLKLDSGDKTQAIADTQQVSRASVFQADKVRAEGSASLQRAVDSNKVPVSRAAAVTKLPKSEQLAAATKEIKKPDEPDLAVRYEFDAGDEEYIARKDREYQQSIDKVMDSDDRLGTANKEIERLSGLVAMLTRARDEYMAQHGAAMKFIKRLQRDKEKLTSQLDKSKEAA